MIGLTRRDTEREFTEFASVITPRLFRSALLLSGDWQLAEDLVQTTLAKLFVGWGKVSKADNPQAYAHGALTKTFLSHKRVRRNSETPTETMADHVWSTPDPRSADGPVRCTVRGNFGYGGPSRGRPPLLGGPQCLGDGAAARLVRVGRADPGVSRHGEASREPLSL